MINDLAKVGEKILQTLEVKIGERYKEYNGNYMSLLRTGKKLDGKSIKKMVCTM